MRDAEQSAPVADDAVQRVKAEFEKTLDVKLESLRREIHQAQTKGVSLTEAARATWSETMADLEAKHKSAVLPLVLGAIAIAAQGCTQKPSEKPVEHTVRKVPAEASEELKQTKTEFEGVLKANLERLEEEVRELKMRAGKLEQSARAKWNEEVAELDAKQKAARDKLDEVAKSTGEAWKSLRGGAKNAWDELEKAVEKARKEF